MNPVRAVVVPMVAALLLFAAAIAFASSWIDDPPDNTCGSVWRTDLWADSDDCRTTMAGRALGAVLIAGTGVALVVAVALGRQRRWLYITSAVSVLLAAVVLLINESVRSGGGW
jgi:hypothetical protein